MVKVQLFLLFAVAVSQSEVKGQADDPFIVDAGLLGKIRGTRGTTYEEHGQRNEYVQFRGIPYAENPPRFSPSVLLEKNLGEGLEGETFNATNVLNCYQPNNPMGTEDCLVLNVYTREKYTGNDTNLKPVLLFVHGGAFTVGYGAFFSGMRLMNRDSVYVNMNYRLGLLGFFSLQNEDVPGNAGMYDVVNALLWVKKYIKFFNGDPDNITIVGQSAGAVTVTQLMVSPLARDENNVTLFHKAIAASGSALNRWGTATNPIPESLKVATIAGCYDESGTPDFVEIATCMRTVNATDLVTVLYDYQVAERREGRLGFAVVSPVVQDFEMTAHPKFLPEHPRTVFEEGREAQVPLMMSSTKHDGSYVLGVFYNRFLKDNGLENNSTFLSTQLVSTILNALEIPNQPGVHDVIAKAYLGDSRLSGDLNEMWPGLMDIFSVFFFKGDIYETALLHSRTSPTFWSSFEFSDKATFWGSLFPGGETPPFPGGVTHTDDLIYLFPLTFQSFTGAESAMSTRMLNYWTEFARTGVPSTNWPELKSDTESYLEMGLTSEARSNYGGTFIGPGHDTVPSNTKLPPLVVDSGVLGTIRGTIGNSYEDQGVRREYIQFRGIPYAKIPERFAPSEPMDLDLGEGSTFNATNVISCYQPNTPGGVENCLVLNVYTHRKYEGNDTDLRPVVFYVHGGAFTVGYGAFFSGARVMSRDIVYVSFNYRLGLFGFFSLQNDDVPGNAAMYDVANALLWVKKYIKNFGGDPDNITIAGQSAGAVTVTQLMVSPLTKDLFHNAIAASGSALNSWGTATDPIPESLKVATRAGCYDLSGTPNFTQIAECMRAKDPNALVEILFNYQVAERQQGRLGFAVVSPVVQDFEMTKYPKFLPEHPRTVFNEGREAQVPLMMSSTKHDGSYVLGVFYNRFLKDNELVNDSEFLSTRLVSTILTALDVPNFPGLHDLIASNYLGDAQFSGNMWEMYPGLMDIFSVFFFKGDTYETALLHSRTSPTFWSSFEFTNGTSFWGQLFPGGETPPFPGGVTHTDDMIYLFGLTFMQFTEAEANMSTKMMSYWADFARSGSPSPDWPQLTMAEENYLTIGFESTVSQKYRETWIGPGMDTFPEPTEPPITAEPTSPESVSTEGSTDENNTQETAITNESEPNETTEPTGEVTNPQTTQESSATSSSTDDGATTEASGPLTTPFVSLLVSLLLVLYYSA